MEHEVTPIFSDAFFEAISDEMYPGMSDEAFDRAYDFGRLLEAQLQMDALKTAFNTSEEGVEPEQVKAISEGQTFLSGALWGLYTEIRGTGDAKELSCAQSWLEHLREIRQGNCQIVLFPNSDPIPVHKFLTDLISLDYQNAYIPKGGPVDPPYLMGGGSV